MLLILLLLQLINFGALIACFLYTWLPVTWARLGTFRSRYTMCETDGSFEANWRALDFDVYNGGAKRAHVVNVAAWICWSMIITWLFVLLGAILNTSEDFNF